MRITKRLFSAGICCVMAAMMYISGAVAATPLSKYGQIQNVQNYSTNPFWSPNGPYNQRVVPQVVYATGPDVETDDCLTVVGNLIAAQCSMENDCATTRLSDIRPIIMLQLSRMPGHNYATACAGYIDSAFDLYQEKYSNAGPSGTRVPFPAATTPSPTNTDVALPEIIPTPPVPQWKQEMLERQRELDTLQSQNGAGNEQIVRADFPTTAADLSFVERQQNAAAGYAPYANADAYLAIDVETKEEQQQRQLLAAQRQAELDRIHNGDTSDNTSENNSDNAGDNNTAAQTSQDTSAAKADMESVLPWYGILVVKKGSLDNYANSETPIISTEYMKNNKSQFYPDNSNVPLGMWGACTHGNHMAADNDVVNRAAHITMGEEDSFWSGNDYYVYDGEDVYLGWATIVGEVAMAIATAGLSSAGQAAAAASQAALGASHAVTAARVTTNAAKLQKAITAAKAAKSGTSAAAVASRAEAVKALAEAGVTVKKGTRATQLVKIGNAMERTASGVINAPRWTTALFQPWRLVKPGLQTLKPKNIKALYGPGVSWGKRVKRALVPAAAVGMGYELLKAFGYSSASTEIAKDVKFNSFGLLSADDQEGRENVVSHGAWIQFEEAGSANEDDALNEALAFAEAFQEDMHTINKKNPECDVDIYVVQPGIKTDENTKKRSIYYIIQNPGGSLRVSK